MLSSFVRKMMLVMLVASATAWWLCPESEPAFVDDCAPCEAHPSACLCMEPVLIHAQR